MLKKALLVTSIGWNSVIYASSDYHEVKLDSETSRDSWVDGLKACGLACTFFTTRALLTGISQDSGGRFSLGPLMFLALPGALMVDTALMAGSLTVGLPVSAVGSGVSQVKHIAVERNIESHAEELKKNLHASFLARLEVAAQLIGERQSETGIKEIATALLLMVHQSCQEEGDTLLLANGYHLSIHKLPKGKTIKEFPYPRRVFKDLRYIVKCMKEKYSEKRLKYQNDPQKDPMFMEMFKVLWGENEKHSRYDYQVDSIQKIAQQFLDAWTQMEDLKPLEKAEKIIVE